DSWRARAIFAQSWLARNLKWY
ncbi:glnD PII-uridylyltransferase family protein, partial [Vibrio parahaemolyticus V-223/04]